MLFISFVLCQCLSVGLRTHGDLLYAEEKKCTFTAEPSDPVKFDVASLFFKDPDFTFFESREFFLSPSSDCDLDLNIKLSKVPNSTTAKRLQQEQRFKVKQIAEGLKAAKTRQLGDANKVLEKFKAQSEEIPAVELHMFPEDPLLNSTWMASCRNPRNSLAKRSTFVAPGNPNRSSAWPT